MLAADAIWLSRAALSALPSWAWIGAAGLALIVGGITFARRESVGGVTKRMRDQLADWR